MKFVAVHERLRPVQMEGCKLVIDQTLVEARLAKPCPHLVRYNAQINCAHQPIRYLGAHLKGGAVRNEERISA